MQTLTDTTLRPIIFGLKPVLEIVSDPTGKYKVLKTQVTKEQFDSYEHLLKIMAQMSRLVYCDSGNIQQLIEKPSFGGDNAAFDKDISQVDSASGLLGSKARYTRTNLPGNIEGRPMQSYIVPSSSGRSASYGTYISTPSDFTFLVISGSKLAAKHPFIKPTDVLVSFKGSSTMENFKHDLYSQFTPADLKAKMPPGTTSSSTDQLTVTGAFLDQVVKSWKLLFTDCIQKMNPTRLFITGHSLGAAFASLFAFVLMESNSLACPVHLITFGSPTLLSDTARNRYNTHLNSGKLTLDRVVSYSDLGVKKVFDVIPSIPVGFTHPGYQPLQTEFYPETSKGRAYNLPAIRKVYQTGGVFGFGAQKAKYEQETLTHAPNKILIPVTGLARAFPHAEYFGMGFKGAFRQPGMKIPGFSTHTFVANLYVDGVAFKYADLNLGLAPAAEPLTQSTMGTEKGGRTKRLRSHKRKTHRR